MKVEDIVAVSAIALGNVMSDDMDLDYYERKMRRQFSEKFHTPYPEVEKMGFDEILTHLFESRYESLKDSDLDESDEILWDDIQSTIDPSYKKNHEKENEDFNEQIAAKQRQKHSDSTNLAQATEQAKAMSKGWANDSAQGVKAITANTEQKPNRARTDTEQPQPSIDEEAPLKSRTRVFEDDLPPSEANSTQGLDSLDDILKKD